MSYYFGLLTVTISVAIGTISFYLSYVLLKKWKIGKILNAPFRDEYVTILNNIPLYKMLTDSDKKKIQKSILIFINTKNFIGIKTDVSDEMKVVIAFHASLLLLHSNINNLYDNLSNILIYPHTIIARQINYTGGIVSKGDFLLEGQSSGESVVIAWDDAKKDAYHLYESNVLLHEFAHEIDFMNGSADGTPPLAYSKYHEWAQVLSKEFNKLLEVALKDRDWGKYKIIGAYAATNEAEFFAVITERYFETPQKLKKLFPDLYEEFNSFYKIY